MPSVAMLTCLLIVSLTAAKSAAQDIVRIDIQPGITVNTMAGGIGASWHAIEDSIPMVGQSSHGGSAWGANPSPDDDLAWHQVFRHAGWLGLDFCRVELEQRMYEPERKQYDWESREMRILYRILDWCELMGVDVFLQQMWSNVDWLAYPEFRGDPILRVHSAPHSLEDFADGVGELAEHLLKRRGYTCIRWLSINNEPGHSWSWWQTPPNEPASITPGLEAVRRELDRRGLDIPLSGPDWTDTPALEPVKIDFDAWIGAYDIHSYYSTFDWQECEDCPGDLNMTEVVRRLGDWAGWAHQRGKPFFLSEVGSMAFGWRGTSLAPNSFEAVLKDVELVVRGLNAGVDGFNRWSFNNRGNLDGQWQMLSTWDIAINRLKEQFCPQPNSYFVYGLVSRFTARHSRVMGSSVTGGEAGGLPRVFAAALESPSGDITVLIVNDARQPWPAEIAFSATVAGFELNRYQVTSKQRDNLDLRIEPLQRFTATGDGKPINLVLPPFSLTVLSSYRLTHGDAGVISD